MNYLLATLHQASVPGCGPCQARINGATDALAWEETIVAWVEGD